SFIPYFARYPYETFVAPRATRPSLAHLSAAELVDFAAVLRETLIRLDNLWRMAFPYVMVLHPAPTDRAPSPGFHFHIQIHPPLRKPGLLKYLAGPEIGGGNFLNDAAPEETAAELQAAASVHYTEGGGRDGPGPPARADHRAARPHPRRRGRGVRRSERGAPRRRGVRRGRRRGGRHDLCHRPGG